MPLLPQAIVAGVILAGFAIAFLTAPRPKDGPRRLGITGGMLGIADELFAPSRQEMQAELNQQMILPAPAPLPGDDDFGITLDLDARKVVLNLPEASGESAQSGR